MISTQYTAIRNTLQDLNRFEAVDYFTNQFQQIGEAHVYASPAAYIQCMPVEWTQLSNNVQRGELEFSVYVLSLTSYGDENDILDIVNINHLAHEMEVYKSLVGKRFKMGDVIDNLPPNLAECNIIESITRKSSTVHDQIDNLIITVQTFETTIFDYAAVPQYQKVIADLCINVTYQ